MFRWVKKREFTFQIGLEFQINIKAFNKICVVVFVYYIKILCYCWKISSFKIMLVGDLKDWPRLWSLVGINVWSATLGMKKS